MNEPHLSSSNRSMEYLLYSLDDVADIIRDKVYADENDKVGGVYDAAQKVIEYVTALASQPPGAFGYAQRLAAILWEKHWKDDAPEWKPLPDIVGVLTQIDNMVAGLSRDLPQAAPLPVEAIRAAVTLLARKITKLSWIRDECRRKGQDVYVSNLTMQINKLDEYYHALSSLAVRRPGVKR